MRELKFLSFQDISLFNLNLEKVSLISILKKVSLISISTLFWNFSATCAMWMHGPLQHFRGLIMTTTMMIFMVLDWPIRDILTPALPVVPGTNLRYALVLRR